MCGCWQTRAGPDGTCKVVPGDGGTGSGIARVPCGGAGQPQGTGRAWKGGPPHAAASSSRRSCGRAPALHSGFAAAPGSTAGPCRPTLVPPQARIVKFKQWIESRPETVIVAFGHCSFWKRFCRDYCGVAKDPMKNCEVRHFQI